MFVTGPTTSSFDAVYRIDSHGTLKNFYRGLGRPQGLAFDAEGNLYVAAEGDNAIYKLKGAGTKTASLGKGQVVYDDQTVLHGPLGLIFAPNGDLITANADPTHFSPSATDPSEIIEITPGGVFVRRFSIVTNECA